MPECPTPSVHPETGAYQWINSPTDTEVLDAPDWLLDQINNGRHAALKNNTSERIDNSSQQRDSVLWKNDLESSKSFNQLTDIEKAIVCLEHLAPQEQTTTSNGLMWEWLCTLVHPLYYLNL